LNLVFLYLDYFSKIWYYFNINDDLEGDFYE